MRFVDFFSGLGGFHIAMKRLGHTCVFACEIDDTLRETYRQNFGIVPHGDIRVVKPKEVPAHDILCAGFPCQPFSKAGGQLGLECPRFGNLFNNILSVIRFHHPVFLIFENVPNLARHDGGATWTGMRRDLEAEGYALEQRHYSPHQFGIPQTRDRIYIVGSLRGLKCFRWPEPPSNATPDIRSILSKKPRGARPLGEEVIACLNAWQDFVRRFPKNEELPTHPIWSMEFGATYPFDGKTPHAIGRRLLGEYRGSHGKKLGALRPIEQLQSLPSHARCTEEVFPEWKVRLIRRNRKLYARHKEWIRAWIPSILRFPSSYQKLEWNCKGEDRDIWKHLIQFRASGVRVKRANSTPSLVAMSTSQIPIVTWEQRYMTLRECARLQSLDSLKYLPKPDRTAFMALGNAVNVDVVATISKALLRSATAVGTQQSRPKPSSVVHE